MTESAEGSGAGESSYSYHNYKLKHRREHLPFDVENWYEWLGVNHTFETFFVDLTIEEARSMLAWYHHRYNHRPKPAREDQLHIRSVRDRLHQHLKEPGKNWFIRLSSRSPKDAGNFTREEFESEVEKWRSLTVDDELLEKIGKEEMEANVQMLAYSQLTWSCQQTQGGLQASNAVLERLVSSERMLVDLIEATEAQEVYSLKIILRVWEPTLRQDYEFRGFVNDGRLTAITQYNHYCFFPHVLREKESLQTALQSYWESSVKPLIPLDSYIVDFAVLSSGRILVIELNPFKSTTGAALFSWTHDHELLHHGPFEFRVHESVPKGLTSFVQHAIEEGFRQIEEDKKLTGIADFPFLNDLNKRQVCILL